MNQSQRDKRETSKTEWDDTLLFEVAVDPFQQIATSGKEEGRAAGLRDGYLEGVNIGRSKGWEIGLELGYIHDFVQVILNGYQQSSLEQTKRQQSSSDTDTPQPTPTDQEESQICSQDKIPVQRTSHRLDRCLTLARDLITMVDNFPDPDTLLSQNSMRKETDSSNDSIAVKCDEASSSNNECCMGSNQQCTNQSTNPSCCSKSGRNFDETETLLGKDKRKQSTSFPPQSNSAATILDVSTSLERIRAKFKLLCVLLKTNQSFDLKKVMELSNGMMDEGTGNKGEAPANVDDTIGKKDYDDPDPRRGVRESKQRADSHGLKRGEESSTLESDW